MIRHVALDGFETDALPVKFEAGTPPIVPVIGLGAAIDYLADIGMEAVIAHERLLSERTYEVLGSIEGVRLFGAPSRVQAPGLQLHGPRNPPFDIAQLLDRQGIAVRSGHHCTLPLHRRFGLTATVRASFAVYNTLAEIEQLGEAIQEAIWTFRHGEKPPP